MRDSSQGDEIGQAQQGVGTWLVVTSEDREYNTQGCYVYVNHTIIHRDPAVYGENGKGQYNVNSEM